MMFLNDFIGGRHTVVNSELKERSTNRQEFVHLEHLGTELEEFSAIYMERSPLPHTSRNTPDV